MNRVMSKIVLIFLIVSNVPLHSAMDVPLPSAIDSPVLKPERTAEEKERIAEVSKKFKKFKKRIKETKADEREYDPRGLLIFLDDSEASLGAISGDLLKALAQKAGPIITTASLLKNIFSEYPNVAVGEPKNLEGRFRRLSLEKNSEFEMEKKKIVLRALQFDEKQWTFKKVNESICLIIPHSYLNELGLSVDEVRSVDDTIISPIEYALGLKVNHIKTVSLDGVRSSAIGGNINDDFLRSLSKIFCFRTDFNQPNDRIMWSFYLVGHGKMSDSIAGLSLRTFQEVLNFFETKIYCRFFAYDSCYAAGVNTERIYQDNRTNITKTFSFPIVTYALTDVTTSTRLPCVEEKNGELVLDCETVDFKAFFRAITNRGEIDYREAVKSIYFEINPSNEPQLKLPGTEWFSVMAVNDNVISIGAIQAKTRDAEHALDVTKFFKRDPKSILLYAQDIPFELVINSKRLEAVVSMIPGDANHKIRKISSSNMSARSIVSKFMSLTNLAPRKLFFIEVVSGQDREFKNVVILNHRMNLSGWVVPVGEHKGYAYYTDDDETYFQSADTWNFADQRQKDESRSLLAEFIQVPLGQFKFIDANRFVYFKPQFPETLNSSTFVEKIETESSISQVIYELSEKQSSGLIVWVKEMVGVFYKNEIDIPGLKFGEKITLSDVIINGKDNRNFFFTYNGEFYQGKKKIDYDYRSESNLKMNAQAQQSDKSLLPSSITSDGIEKIKEVLKQHADKGRLAEEEVESYENLVESILAHPDKHDAATVQAAHCAAKINKLVQEDDNKVEDKVREISIELTEILLQQKRPSYNLKKIILQAAIRAGSIWRGKWCLIGNVRVSELFRKLIERNIGLEDIALYCLRMIDQAVSKKTHGRDFLTLLIKILDSDSKRIGNIVPIIVQAANKAMGIKNPLYGAADMLWVHLVQRGFGIEDAARAVLGEMKRVIAQEEADLDDTQKRKVAAKASPYIISNNTSVTLSNACRIFQLIFEQKETSLSSQARNDAQEAQGLLTRFGARLEKDFKLTGNFFQEKLETFKQLPRRAG